MLIACKNNPTAIEILELSSNTINSLNTVEYEMKHRIKYFSSQDTTEMIGKCLVERNSIDTVFGNHFKINLVNGYQYLYNNKDLLLLDKKNKRARIDSSKNKNTKIITGSYVQKLIFKPVFNGFNIQQYNPNSYEIKLISSDKKEWVIQLIFTDDSLFKNKIETLYINKKTNLPTRLISSIEFNKMIEYKDITINYLDLKRKPTSLSEFKIPADYELSYFNISKPKQPSTLKKGNRFPEFTFKNEKNEIINSVDLKGKLVVIDYWYKACLPCIKAMPFLEEINKKYGGEKLIVLGMNSKDKNRKEINNYLKQIKVSYPTLFTTEEFTDSCKVSAYPTIYLIDKKGELLASYIGYNQKYEQELELLIQKNI